VSMFSVPLHGNVGNRHCPACRSPQVSQRWEYATSYFCCDRCGYVWGKR
jgi:endogenous inhibitor of DNA gyrase (YacG/DUF329 family)